MSLPVLGSATMPPALAERWHGVCLRLEARYCMSEFQKARQIRRKRVEQIKEEARNQTNQQNERATKHRTVKTLRAVLYGDEVQR